MELIFRDLYAITTGLMSLIGFALAIYFGYINKRTNGLAKVLFQKHISQFILFGTISMTLLLFSHEIYWLRWIGCFPYILAYYYFIQYIIKISK